MSCYSYFADRNHANMGRSLGDLFSPVEAVFRMFGMSSENAFWGGMALGILTPSIGSKLAAAKGVGAIEGAVSQGARTEARTLAEQLSLKEAQAGAGERIMQGKINDPKFPADEWAKMQHLHTTPEGQNIVIHYWERLGDALRTGFKFKD